jgi:hypothetical protein
MKIIYLKKALAYLDKLAPILYEKEIYFGFLEDAKRYVKDIYDRIDTEILIQQHKPTPEYFEKYGNDMKYIIIRKNKKTHWYVFFKTSQKDGEIIHKIRYITNNHVSAQYFPGDKLN